MAGSLDQARFARSLTRSPSTASEDGNRRSAHGTVSGKALLDFLPPDQIQQIPATELETVTAKTIISPETPRQQVAEIRHRGHAIEIEDQAGFGR
jgi:DNA-binding IclR family transcriptional regulator